MRFYSKRGATGGRTLSTGRGGAVQKIAVIAICGLTILVACTTGTARASTGSQEVAIMKHAFTLVYDVSHDSNTIINGMTKPETAKVAAAITRGLNLWNKYWYKVAPPEASYVPIVSDAQSCSSHYFDFCKDMAYFYATGELSYTNKGNTAIKLTVKYENELVNLVPVLAGLE